MSAQDDNAGGSFRHSDGGGNQSGETPLPENEETKIPEEIEAENTAAISAGEKAAEELKAAQEAVAAGDIDKANAALERVETCLSNLSNSQTTLAEKLTAQITALETKISSIQPTPSPEILPPPNPAETIPPVTEQPPAPNPKESADAPKVPPTGQRARRKAI